MNVMLHRVSCRNLCLCLLVGLGITFPVSEGRAQDSPIEFRLSDETNPQDIAPDELAIGSGVQFGNSPDGAAFGGDATSGSRPVEGTTDRSAFDNGQLQQGRAPGGGTGNRGSNNLSNDDRFAGLFGDVSAINTCPSLALRRHSPPQ